MHLKGNMFARKYEDVSYIYLAVIYPCAHVCMQLHPCHTKNSVRFAYISVYVD